MLYVPMSISSSKQLLVRITDLFKHNGRTHNTEYTMTKGKMTIHCYYREMLDLETLYYYVCE